MRDGNKEKELMVRNNSIKKYFNIVGENRNDNVKDVVAGKESRGRSTRESKGGTEEGKLGGTGRKEGPSNQRSRRGTTGAKGIDIYMYENRMDRCVLGEPGDKETDGGKLIHS